MCLSSFPFKNLAVFCTKLFIHTNTPSLGNISIWFLCYFLLVVLTYKFDWIWCHQVYRGVSINNEVFWTAKMYLILLIIYFQTIVLGVCSLRFSNAFTSCTVLSTSPLLWKWYGAEHNECTSIPFLHLCLLEKGGPLSAAAVAGNHTYFLIYM